MAIKEENGGGEGGGVRVVDELFRERCHTVQNLEHVRRGQISMSADFARDEILLQGCGGGTS
jgi:hypothetical protein